VAKLRSWGGCRRQLEDSDAEEPIGEVIAFEAGQTQTRAQRKREEEQN